MDVKVQNFEHQKAFVKIEKKGKYLGLYNAKISEKINYVLEADPELLEEKKIEHKLMKKMKYGDDIEKDPDVSINYTQSSASCYIKDIQIMTFGGFSTRFWALRKHINCLRDDQMDNLPFYSWQCLSLKLKHREVDLVICDEQQMNLLVKYLLIKMESIDG